MARRLQLVDTKLCEAMMLAFPWPHWFHVLQVDLVANICGYDFVDPLAKQSGCRGDSGSPLVVFSRGAPFQVGIMSEGWEFPAHVQCMPVPVVYTATGAK